MLAPFSNLQIVRRITRTAADRSILNENDGLRTRDLEPLSTSHVLTHELIVDADHIIARLLETSPIMLIQMPWPTLLFSSLHPTNIIVVTLAAKRTRKRGLLDLLPFVEYIPFLHGFILQQGNFYNLVGLN
jgi:hypothetical protein